MGWKKVVIGGALLTAGFFTMFEMLIMDETNLKGLDETDAAFVAYLTLYNKQYLSIDDYKFRKQWFGKSVDIISKQNLFKQGFVLGLNHMSDWTDDEYYNTLGLLEDKEFPQSIIPHNHSEMVHNENFDKKYPDRPYSVDNLIAVADTGSEKQPQTEADSHQQRRVLEDENTEGWNMGEMIRQKIKEHTGINIERPRFSQLGMYNESSWHRRKDGKPSIITKAKDQGRNCSASYAFAVVAALEAAQALEEGHLPNSLSEQQIVDCTFDGGHHNFGCLGGSLRATTEYVTSTAIHTSKAYPYIHAQNQDCGEEDSTKGLLHSYVSHGFDEIPAKSAHALMTALDKGPVVAAVRAGSDVFRHFSDGVIDSVDCTAKAPGQKFDHAVLVVGSGTTSGGMEYFLIKNSFSKSWGDKGFARIAASNMRSPEGVCGILSSLWQPKYHYLDQ